MVQPHSSNFRVSTTNVLGVRIFRKFTVYVKQYNLKTVNIGTLKSLLFFAYNNIMLSENRIISDL